MTGSVGRVQQQLRPPLPFSSGTSPTRAPSPGLFQAIPALPPTHYHSETAPSCQVDSYFHQAACDVNEDCVGITYQLTANVCW